MWVPSYYVGINGNEKANEVAFLATKNLTYNTINKISSSDIFTSIKNKIVLSWQHHWDSIPHTNKLKSIKSSVKQWHTPSDLSRSQDIAISRIIIGHALATHSFFNWQRRSTYMQYMSNSHHNKAYTRRMSHLRSNTHVPQPTTQHQRNP
ncbi:RNase H domain-containing protein [Aphis craccivora]|uniref:RNase H domain-containing protein n=1 Tax=Aphis craccivora TaxID=307492 RepID=A0A6G0Y3B6_APHCR|nr:RNase H domain-containing protein [Aphis craccivora]